MDELEGGWSGGFKSVNFYDYSSLHPSITSPSNFCSPYNAAHTSHILGGTSMTVDINEFKREAKIREWKAKIKSGWDKTKQLVVDHPAESVAVLTSVIGAGVGLIKRADRKADLKKAEQLKDRYIYDRSIGGYWHTRRKLTSSDMLEIERQKKAGRGTGEILRDMRLL